MMPRLRSLPRLCWRLLQSAFTKDYSGVNRWKNHHLVGGDPSGKCVVAFFNDCFGELFDFHNLSGPAGVQFTGNANKTSHADVVVFPIPTLRATPFEKRSGQLWVAWSLESTENYPCLRDPGFLGQFDLTMTYQATADVWFPYVAICLKNPLEDLRRPVSPKKSARLISSFVSSGFNLSGRQEYHTELTQYLDLHAYENFGRTHILKRDKGKRSKLETIAQYKFTIAFENSIDEDYVTEKFFDPLLVGSVPVYLGAPNVSRFAPGEKSYIDIRDFHDPKSLADFIQYLDEDDHAYFQYFEWKNKPYQKSFTDMVEYCKKGSHPLEQLGKLVLSKSAPS